MLDVFQTEPFLHDSRHMEPSQVRVVLFLDVARKMVWPLALLNRFFVMDRASGQVGARDPRQREGHSRLIEVTGPAIFSMRAIASASGSIATSI